MPKRILIGSSINEKTDMAQKSPAEAPPFHFIDVSDDEAFEDLVARFKSGHQAIGVDEICVWLSRVTGRDIRKWDAVNRRIYTHGGIDNLTVINQEDPNGDMLILAMEPLNQVTRCLQFPYEGLLAVDDHKRHGLPEEIIRRIGGRAVYNEQQGIVFERHDFPEPTPAGYYLG